MSSARNAGLIICTDDFVSFVDSDNYIIINMYEDLIKYITSEIDIVGFGLCEFDDSGKKENIELKNTSFTCEEAICHILLMDGNVRNFACNKIFRHSFVYVNYDLMRKKYGEDSPFVYYNLKRVNVFRQICTPLFFIDKEIPL